MTAATIGLLFDRLSGGAPDRAPVSPALPRVLEILARRNLRASFVIPPQLADDEPFAVTMTTNARHEVLGQPPQQQPAARAAEGDAPGEWHASMQLAVGRAVGSKQPAILAFELAALERGDSAGLFAETLDLVAGLERAGSVQVLAPR